VNTLSFNCPGCKQTLEIPEELLGKIVECPACNGCIQLPQPEPTSKGVTAPKRNRKKTILLCSLSVAVTLGLVVGALLHNQGEAVSNTDNRAQKDQFSATQAQFTGTWGLEPADLPNGMATIKGLYDSRFTFSQNTFRFAGLGTKRTITYSITGVSGNKIALAMNPTDGDPREAQIQIVSSNKIIFTDDGDTVTLLRQRDSAVRKHSDHRSQTRVPNSVIQAKEVITVHLGPAVTLDLLPVAAGSFEMGSTDGDADERPVHTVTISRDFWMGKHEVTQEQWRPIMNADSGWPDPSWFGGDTRPVERVNWFAAMVFCRNMTEREGRAGRVPAGYEYRLPTEAEWE